MQDLRSNKDVIFGGVPVVIAGDFRQTLPIVPKGTAADQLKACLKQSYLWHHPLRKSLSLRTNMRALTTGDLNTRKFSSQLLSIGNGQVPHTGEESIIDVPGDLGTQVKTEDDFQTLMSTHLMTLTGSKREHYWQPGMILLTESMQNFLTVLVAGPRCTSHLTQQT